MASKLSDRQILQLHDLSKQGFTATEIAKRLSIHTNSVFSHLARRVAYSPSVAAKLPNIPIPNKSPMSIYDASIFLPGWPSRSKVYKLYRAGILRAKVDLKSSNHQLVTDYRAVRKAALAMLDSGIWIKSITLAAMIRSVAAYDDCIRLAVECRYWPNRDASYINLIDVHRVLRYHGESISVSPSIIHRCLRVYAVAGVATF